MAGLSKQAGLDFTLAEVNGQGVLSLPSRRIWGCLSMERLSLQVPEDFSLGVREDNTENGASIQLDTRLQNLRLNLLSLQLSLSAEELNERVRAVEPDLRSAGVYDCTVELADGCIELRAQVRQAALSAPMTARLYLEAQGDSVHITTSDVRVYGHFNTPVHVLVHGLVAKLCQATKLQASVLGLGRLSVPVLDRGLLQFLVEKGWRLPRTKNVHITSLSCRPEGISITLGQGATALAGGDSLNCDNELYQRLARMDECLLAGDSEAALADYRGELMAAEQSGVVADQLVILDRIFGVLSAHREYFMDGLELAEQTLLRFPDFVPAHLAIAAICLAQGKTERACQAFQEVGSICAARKDVYGCVPALLSAGLLLMRFAPERSTAMFEAVLRQEPLHPEACARLIERYQKEQRWREVAALLRTQLACFDQLDAPQAYVLEQQIACHVRLADVLLEQLNDSEGAVLELASACRKNPRSASLLQRRAFVESRLGNSDEALALRNAAQALLEESGDLEAQIENLLAGAETSFASGAFVAAEQWFKAAHFLCTGGLRAGGSEATDATIPIADYWETSTRGIARSAAQLGRHVDAASSFKKLCCRSSNEHGPKQARDCLELGQSLEQCGDFDEAMVWFTEAKTLGGPRTRGEALVALARLHLVLRTKSPEPTSEGILDVGKAVGWELAGASDRSTNAAYVQKGELGDQKFLIAALESGEVESAGDMLESASSAFAEAERDEAWPTEMQMHRETRRAEVFLHLVDLAADNDPDKIVQHAASAFDLAPPNSPVRKRAARQLLERSKSHEGQLAWIDELAADNETPDERAYLAIRRCHILSSQGKHEAAVAALDDALVDQVSDAPRRAALEAKAHCLRNLHDPAASADVLALRAALAGSNAERALASVETAERWIEADDVERGAVAARKALQIVAKAETRDARDLRKRALLALGECVWSKRSWADVHETYEELAKQEDAQGMSTQALLRWGCALERLGRKQDAVDLLESVAKRPLEPEVVHAYRVLAELYEQLGDIAKAAMAMERTASIEGAFSVGVRADAWFRAGSLWRRDRSCLVDARRCFEEALRLVPNHMPSLDGLEHLAREGGDNERLAVILGRKLAAVTQDPRRQCAILARLAQLQEDVLGRPDVARSTYQRLLSLDPQNRQALRFVARDANERDDHAVVGECLVRLIDVLPADSELPRTESELEEEREEAAGYLQALIEGDLLSKEAEVSLVPKLREAKFAQLCMALENLYRRRNDLLGAAEMLKFRRNYAEPKETLALDLHRLAIYADQLADYEEARNVLREAVKENPDAKALASWKLRLERTLAAVANEEQIFDVSSDAEKKAHELGKTGIQARERGELEVAYQQLSQAASLEPTSPRWQELCADVACDRGEMATAAQWFERLAHNKEVGADRRGEAFLCLSQLYQQHLQSPATARNFLVQAAITFTSNERRNALLRLVALEAMAAKDVAQAVFAYETIGFPLLSPRERRQLAELYDESGKVQEAIDVLGQLVQSGAKEGRSIGGLSGQLADLLERQRAQRVLVEELEATAKLLPRDSEKTVLMEALRIYQDVLSDFESAHRLRQELVLRETGDLPTILRSSELKEAALQAKRHKRNVAFGHLLARAIFVCCLEKAALDGVVPEIESMLGRLREWSGASSPKDEISRRDKCTLLESCLLAVVAAQPGAAIEASYLRKAAVLRREELGDPRGAVEHLRRALDIAPQPWTVMQEIDAILRESGDYAELARTYRYYAASQKEQERARPLVELSRLSLRVFREPKRAWEYLEEALLLEPTLPETLQLERELSGCVVASTPKIHASTLSIEEELKRAETLEGTDDAEEAIGLYREAATKAPTDPRPYLALRRLYSERENYPELKRTLEKLTTLSTTPTERAELFHARACLALQVFHDDVLGYEYLKEAAANAPDDQRYASLLRTIAMARGEWALAAELAYREIASSADKAERAALYLELALIFDQKLLDAPQAIVNYEQALRLDPTIPAALRPLARLYELEGKHAEAMEMYQRAAARSLDPAEQGRLLRHAAMNAERSGDSVRARMLYALGAAEGNKGPTAKDEAKGQEGETLHEEALSPDAVQLRFELARAYQTELGDMSAAITAYEEVLRLDPEHFQAMDALADIHFQRCDWGRADDLYRRLSADNSSHSPVEFALRRAEISEALGRDGEALLGFQHARQQGDESPRTLLGICRTARSLGDLACARQALEQLLANLPEHAVGEEVDARIVLAELCEGVEDTEKAVEHYEFVVKERPDSQRALTRLVEFYRSHHSDLALQRRANYLRQLIGLISDPIERGLYWHELGDVYTQSDVDQELASDAYLKAVDLHPIHAPTLRRLLGYYWRIGDHGSACEIAMDLSAQGELLVPETGLNTLHRTALCAGLSGDEALCMEIAQSLGEDLVDELVRATVETLRLPSAPDPGALATAIHAICAESGSDCDEVTKRLQKVPTVAGLEALIDSIARKC